MINRAPIVALTATGNHTEKTKYGPFHKNFHVDMTFLWDILHHVFGGNTVWVHAKPYANIKNGRYALFNLKNFLLGPHYVTHMVAQLKLKLRNFSYDRDKRGFTL